MSKSADIRSFFTVLSSKKPQTTSTPAKNPKKRAIVVDSSDEEIIPDTPTPVKKIEKKVKKPRMRNALSSDSEDEPTREKVVPNKEDPKGLKAVNMFDVLGNRPVKQSKVTVKAPVEEVGNQSKKQEKPKTKKSKKSKLETETGIHDDKDFEKTLLELDDDFTLEDVEELDKTIDEALNIHKTEAAEQQKKVVDDTPKKNKTTKDAQTPSRKRVAEESGIDPDQERYEKRRQSAVLYQKYLNRSGPKHHGSKELPKGKPTCLANLCFLRTGVLDSLEGDEFESLIKEHGGRVVHAVSKKVNYVVAGEEPGPAKLEKARNYDIKIIDEDELLDLIRTKSGMEPKSKKSESDSDNKDTIQKDNNETSPHKKQKPTEKSKKSKDASKEENMKIKPEKTEVKPTKTDIKSENIETKQNKSSVSSEKSVKHKTEINESAPPRSEKPEVKPNKIELKKSLKPLNQDGIKKEARTYSLSWTEKYKPSNIKEIIGQQGDKSNVKKLLEWLQNWFKNHGGKNKPKLARPNPWAKNDDGSYFKAALLSGPPGVGKTTTATLVAKELGYDVVEFNASDTRNKRLLHEEVSQLLSTKSLAGFFAGGSAPTKKHVLLMDEVDGMAGNEDRGGIQELISLIKDSSIPIICMCNDRNHQKMRSVANYCFDLRFAKPRLEQIRGAMMSVCFKEGIAIKPDALTEVITGAGMDIRQVLTNLSLWSAGEKALSAETASKGVQNSKKDVPLGPWEVCRKVFSEDDHKSMSIGDRSRLFYYDYSLAPLFVQENYLKVMPHAPKNQHLARFAAAADAISLGDLTDTKIRKSNNWSLLDVEAMYASVLPGHYLKGHMNGQIDFPNWLGKNSKKNKFSRLLSELQAHMRTSISGSRSAVNLDYTTHLRNGIIRPLVKEGTAGVSDALEVMHAYNLLREDFDSIIELAHWPRQKDAMAMVDSKVKAAFTRAYNKGGAKLPYAIQAAPVKKRGGPALQEEFEEEEVESGPEDEEDVTKDAMIKAKKASAKENKKDSGESSKGRGGKKNQGSAKATEKKEKKGKK